MPLRVNEKKIVVDELHRIANEASSAVAADYHGCSVAELTKFRKNARNLWEFAKRWRFEFGLKKCGVIVFNGEDPEKWKL